MEYLTWGGVVAIILIIIYLIVFGPITVVMLLSWYWRWSEFLLKSAFNTSAWEDQSNVTLAIAALCALGLMVLYLWGLTAEEETEEKKEELKPRQCANCYSYLKDGEVFCDFCLPKK